MGHGVHPCQVDILLQKTFKISFSSKDYTKLLLFFSFTVKPQFKVKPKNTTAYEGYPVTLHCVATGDPTPTIQWDKNNKYINAVNNTRFTVSVRVCRGACINPVNNTRFMVSGCACRVRVCKGVLYVLFTYWKNNQIGPGKNGSI